MSKRKRKQRNKLIGNPKDKTFKLVFERKTELFYASLNLNKSNEPEYIKKILLLEFKEEMEKLTEYLIKRGVTLSPEYLEMKKALEN